MPAQDIITKVEIWPVDVPLTEPFVVATGRLVTAQNLFVRITLKSGARGYGEIAPFPEVGGDDRPTCLQIATQLALARAWYSRGLRLFKTKVGMDVEQDIRRLEAVHRALPDVAFIADANQGFTREDCLAFVQGVKRVGARLVLLEQPVAREDLDGLAAVRHLTGVPVAADESVRSLHDVMEVLQKQAADFINIKIMKSGLLAALDIAAYARAAGLRLMIGGMVETRIAMGCSFGLVLGRGGFDLLDLDTPLLLATDPVKGRLTAV